MIKDKVKFSELDDAAKSAYRIIIGIWIFIAIMIGTIGIFIVKSQIKYNDMPTTDQVHIQLMNANEDYLYCPYCGHKLEE